MWMNLDYRQRKQLMWPLMFAQLTLVMIDNGDGFFLQCPLHQMHLQKVLGFRPPTDYLTNDNTIYTPSLKSTGIYRWQQAINFTVRQQEQQPKLEQQMTDSFMCWHICNTDDACIAYVHLIGRRICYGFTYFSGTKSYKKIDNSVLPLVSDPDAVFYEKSCLKVPINCREQRWILTKIPGNSLVFQGKKTLATLVDRRVCAEQCLFETEFKCLSASFIPSYRNNRQRFSQSDDINAKTHQNLLGRCILSDIDKIVQPSAFRATAYDEEYIENHCHQRQIEADSCSYELYANSSFIYAETIFTGLSQKQCLYYCSHETTFYCQGISYFYNNDLLYSECSLHSEDIISMGPRSLKLRQNSVYMRRVKCLDVEVICTQSEMLIKYMPKTRFNGKMYVSHHHYNDNCLAHGNDTNSIELHLHIGNEVTESICGVLRAYEIQNDYRRIFISALVVIQNNPNVQSQGDRLIKVGCIISNNTSVNPSPENSLNASIPQDSTHESTNYWYSAKQQQEGIEVNEPNAITLKSTVDFSRNFLLSEGALHYNISENVYGQIPKITMQIIDIKNGIKTNNVQIGEKLELQIISEYTNKQLEAFSRTEIPPLADFRASSLLAKSVDNEHYVELLDQHGCPTDTSVFPGLSRLRQSTRNLLRGQFHAFKFAGAPIVNFEVKLHFCTNQCPLDNCQRLHKNNYEFIPSNGNLIKIHKQKRSFPVNFFNYTEILNSQHSAYVSNVLVNTETIAEKKHSIEAIPLSFDLHVHGPDQSNVKRFAIGRKGILLLADVGKRKI